MTADLRAVLVDDEQLARDELGYLLGQLGGIEVIGQAGNGVEALTTIDRLQPDVVFANERELAELGAEPSAGTIVVKRGAAGAVVSTAGERTEYEAKAADVVDSTGAGDALAAGFLVGGIELGLEAAARCVAKLGAMP